MEFGTEIGHWAYKDTGYREPGIILEGKLRTSNGWTDSLSFLLDTGFDGEILLSYDFFVLCGFHKFSSMNNTAETINGEIINIIEVNTILKVQNHEYSVLVETSQNISENLVGRGFINLFTSILEGKKSQWSIMET